MQITDYDKAIEALEEALQDYDFNFEYEEKDDGLEAGISEEYIFNDNYSYASLYVNIYDCGEMFIECLFGNTPDNAITRHLLAEINSRMAASKAWLSDEIDDQKTFTISARIPHISSYDDINRNLLLFLVRLVGDDVKEYIQKICAMEITED